MGRGDRVLVERHGEPVAAVVPIEVYQQWKQARGELYARVRARHGMSEQQLAEVIAGFRRFATLVAPEVVLQVIRDDPTDDRFLECAVTGGADYIVSGDTHLLRLGEYAGIQILSPSG